MWTLRNGYGSKIGLKSIEGRLRMPNKKCKGFVCERFVCVCWGERGAPVDVAGRKL